METLINSKLSYRIKELRRQQNITQERLAELTSTNYKYIQRIESKSPPDVRLTTIEKLAKAFKITPSKLLDF